MPPDIAEIVPGAKISLGKLCSWSVNGYMPHLVNEVANYDEE